MVVEKMEMELSVEDHALHLIKELTTGQVQLVAIVEKLGPKLTSTNHDERASGVQTLTKIISSLKDDFLNKDQLTFITAFYSDRLRDHHSVVPSVLDGIMALVNMKNLPSNAASDMLRAMFCNISCQQQIRTDRYNIYSIIHILSNNYTEDVRAMGIDLTLGIMYAMDGERDPRNLLFLFSILPSLLKILDLGHVSEEMFEVIACYFPVDFNTPQDEAKAITRNDLAEKLSLCLCAIPAFDKFCIQLLLEKLESDLKLAKMDSLKLLKQSCSTFKSKSYEPHLELIWKELQRELTVDTDPELKQCAHEALSELLNNLCSDNSLPNVAESFLKMITVTVKCMLIDAKTKLKIDSLFQIYSTAANASENSCIYIIKNVHPYLIEQFNTTPNNMLKYMILQLFTNIFTMCKHWDILSRVADEFKPVIEISIAVAKSCNGELKLSGLRCITDMAEIVTITEAIICQDILNYNINQEHSQIVVDSSKSCLLSLVKQYPACFENFINELCLLGSVSNNNTLLQRKINVLCLILSVDHYTKLIMDNFYTIIVKDVQIAAAILEILSVVIKNKNIFSDDKVQEIQTNQNIIIFLLEWITAGGLRENNKILRSVCDIVVSVMKVQTNDTQLKLYVQLLPTYLSQVLDGQIWLIVVIEALLNSSKIDICIDDLDKIIEAAYSISIKQCDIFTQERACGLIANSLNKYIGNDEIQKVYEGIKSNFSVLVESGDQDEIVYSNSIVLSSWIAKCLLLNGHSDASQWLLKLTQLLKCEKWGNNAAKGFQLIMNDDIYALNRSCHCKVNFLYKQRVFQLFLQFISMQEDFNNNCSEPFFQACTYVIQSIPKSVLLMELSKISSIIVDCLNFDEPEILLPILEIFSYLIQNNKLTCTLQTLLPRLLRLCGFRNNVKVRIASLQCMFDISDNYQTPQLLPFKQDVVLELAKHLDDPKRLVRSVAVKSRTRWYLIGSPGEEKV